MQTMDRLVNSAGSFDAKVSSRGQMSLPAGTRRRWGLEDGGRIGVLDLGDLVILVPGGVQRLRNDMLGAISAETWEQARSGFGDTDLANV